MMLTELCLSVRVQPRRGDVRTEVDVRARPEPGAVWLIFIHGHNVPETRALTDWTTIRDEFLSTLELGGERVCAGPFLWPSDRSYAALSKLTYAEDRDIAERSGRVLGLYLKDKRPRSLVLVGHSLGALVALEAVGRMKSRPDLNLALLAAAVSVADVNAPFGTYSDPDARAVREAITYSPRDTTLLYAFPVGQGVSRPGERVTDAVGLHGEPETRPWADRIEVRSSDHGHWKIKEAYEAVVSAAAGRSGEPPEHEAPEHLAPEWQVPE